MTEEKTVFEVPEGLLTEFRQQIADAAAGEQDDAIEAGAQVAARHFALLKNQMDTRVSALTEELRGVQELLRDRMAAIERIQAEPTDHRYRLEQIALDEYSMVWEGSKGTKGDHIKAMRHVVGVLRFGDPVGPDPRDADQ